VRRLLLSLAFACSAVAAQSPADHWTLARNPNFEVYSQSADNSAQNALPWFEQLRAFFQQNGLFSAGVRDQSRRPLRVIVFRSEKEYDPYRLRPLADAYYASDGRRDYIVMVTRQSAAFAVAAHEYAHHVVNANSLKLPACMQEGLAEYFSTLQVREGAYELGGDLPVRSQTLRANKSKWLPLADLFAATPEWNVSKGRKGVELFYAESWALVDMLIAAPAYASRFPALVAEFNAGSSAPRALGNVYGKSVEEVAKDLANWVGQPHLPRLQLSRATEFQQVNISTLTSLEAESLLAQLLLVSGHTEQAAARYKELLRQTPDNPDFAAALGTIAQRQGNHDEALELWRQAVNNNIKDAELCYRYALLAQDAGLDTHDVSAALERAVLLAPGFDDARYKLALLQLQAGEYRPAVEHLRAMHLPGEARRYAYWTALASALLELDENDEAKAAAQEALKAAQTEPERQSARRTALMAATDLTVQFATDADGRSHVVTTRIPRGTTDWNPFVEPSDQMQRTNGKLSEVLCSKGKLTGFLLRSSNGTVTVEVPDPLHVLMRNSPSEFFCGPMRAQEVEADYAVVKAAGKTTNVLRGMTFPR
jgi:tetratricopeptide (TPR) repeat protein